MWDCLHKVANKYNKGGAITSLSNVLDPVCSVVGIVPSVSTHSDSLGTQVEILTVTSLGTGGKLLIFAGCLYKTLICLIKGHEPLPKGDHHLQSVFSR